VRAFDYSSATTLSDVASSLDGQARPLAGGTDLLPLMKLDVAAPPRLVDIKRVADLRPDVQPDGDGVRIGALTTLAALESHPVLRERYTALAESAGLAASPQLRNMATLGGNLLQRPRCWYFRSSLFHCWLKGGTECHAREGENQYHAILGDSPCVAVHPSDPPAALLLFDAVVHTTRREIALADFFAEPSEDRRTENVLAPDELIVAITLPPARGRSTYLKAMNRKVWAFALVGVAVRLDFAPSPASASVQSASPAEQPSSPSGARGPASSAAQSPESLTVADARVVLNGVATIPYRASAAEAALVGKPLTESSIAAAADAAIASAHPLAHNAYKLPLTQGLLRQALRSLSASS
jgi:xanthine dehydrogenase YagS FAD-binding subunit